MEFLGGFIIGLLVGATAAIIYNAMPPRRY